MPFAPCASCGPSTIAAEMHQVAVKRAAGLEAPLPAQAGTPAAPAGETAAFAQMSALYQAQATGAPPATADAGARPAVLDRRA